MYNNLYSTKNKYEEASDEELIKQIRLGNSEAQDFLIERYRNQFQYI